MKPRIAYVPDPASHAAGDAASRPSLFVRPDGVIAWAATASDADALRRLDTAVRRWVGAS